MPENNAFLDFNKIKADASVHIILSALGFHGHFDTKGDELNGQCVLGEPHGKNDSLSFNTVKKQWQCFSCKRRGSMLDFVRYVNDCSLRDAASYIQDTMTYARSLVDEHDDELSQAMEVNNALKKSQPQKDDLAVATSPPATTTGDDDKPVTITNLQHAVMSWSLAQYRVNEGKLNPDDLIVVDASILEFLYQLTKPEQ